MLFLERTDRVLDLAQLVANPALSFALCVWWGRDRFVCSFVRTIEGKMKVTPRAAGNLAGLRDAGSILCCLTAYPSLSTLVVAEVTHFQVVSLSSFQSSFFAQKQL